MNDRRTPPHDATAERAVIGCAILDNSKIPEIIPIIAPEDFYSGKYRQIWETIITISCAGKKVTEAAIYKHLDGKVSIEDIGKTVEGLPAGSDAEYYAKIVRDKAKLRRVIEASARLAGAAYDGDKETIVNLISDLSSRKITNKRETTLADSVAEWVDKSTGPFTVADCYGSLRGVAQSDRANIRMIFHRMKDKGLIEPTGKRDGQYRKVDNDLEAMDYINAPTDGVEFNWPLELHKICTIFPKDIICIAGANNAGKTGFAVDFVRRNMDKHEIHYFNCEMSASRLKDRLLQVDDVPIDGWKFFPWSRDDNFADVIRPNAVNIIDYLEIVDEHWLVAKRLKEIHNKLDQGIAIVLLQKPENRDTGMGGEKGLQKPTLYVAINYGWAKLVKVKSWKGEVNPNKKVADFNLLHGWKFSLKTEWHSEEAEEAANHAIGGGNGKLFRKKF